jgi:molecular chaperone GrpE
MTEKIQPHTTDFPTDPLMPENDLTVDLTQEEFGEGADLQALADEIGDYEPPKAEVPAEAAGMSREDLEAELARTRARLEALEKAESDHKDKHHRLMADFTNHRNRVGRETQLAVTLAERKVLLELLPVLDSFERCINATYTSLEDFHAGVVLIHRQMQEALRKSGVEPLALNVGDPFDAQHAEALTTTSQASLPDGSVAAIYERGYYLRDQLLRPARVIVNNHPEGDPTQDPS